MSVLPFLQSAVEQSKWGCHRFDAFGDNVEHHAIARGDVYTPRGRRPAAGLPYSRSMNDQVRFLLTLFSALGCGLIAGVFFAFSAFVMKALARISPTHGIAAMQSINIVVINPWFMAAFLGTGVGCLVLAVAALSTWHRPGAAYVAAGSLLYLLGTILVTMVCNVPRNNALAAIDPGSTEGARLWAGYVTSWTAWNHVRTAAALAAAASLTMALCGLRVGRLDS